MQKFQEAGKNDLKIFPVTKYCVTWTKIICVKGWWTKRSIVLWLCCHQFMQSVGIVPQSSALQTLSRWWRKNMLFSIQAGVLHSLLKKNKKSTSFVWTLWILYQQNFCLSRQCSNLLCPTLNSWLCTTTFLSFSLPLALFLPIPSLPFLLQWKSFVEGEF